MSVFLALIFKNQSSNKPFDRNQSRLKIKCDGFQPLVMIRAIRILNRGKFSHIKKIIPYIFVGIF